MARSRDNITRLAVIVGAITGLVGAMVAVAGGVGADSSGVTLGIVIGLGFILVALGVVVGLMTHTGRDRGR